jgi:hypothetical protein
MRPDIQDEAKKGRKSGDTRNIFGSSIFWKSPAAEGRARQGKTVRTLQGRQAV